MLVLHDFFRSGASHRVRIALHLKGLPFEQKFYKLRRGDQRAPDYRALNPQGLVPTLEHDGIAVTQSTAIIEYLDEAFPQTPRLLPSDAGGRARVRALAGIVAADTHPLNNLRVLAYLENQLGLDEAARISWIHRWLAASFEALEGRLSREPATGQFCHGDQPTVADLCLAPQMLSAKRFAFDPSSYLTVVSVAANAAALDAFQRAEPKNQPDAE